MHYKQLLDPGIFLGVADFAQERAVKISRVSRETLPERKGEEKQAAPMLYILDRNGNEYPRKLKLAKSVLHGLSLMFGVETDDWIGKEITPYAAHCLSFGDVEECVRIRFPEHVEAAIYKWLKKRKASRGVYLCDPKQ